jgi:hypothetical protein
MINASWYVLETTFIIWYCVETSPKTLGEIDECIVREYHSDAMVLMSVMKGRVDVEVKNAQFLNGGDHAGTYSAIPVWRGDRTAQLPAIK